MRCKCGCKKFYADQGCRGIVTVIVDENGDFLENATEDGKFDENCLDFDEPELPYYCVICGVEYIEPEESLTQLPF